jgi:hypothetical protein
MRRKSPIYTSASIAASAFRLALPIWKQDSKLNLLVAELH